MTYHKNISNQNGESERNVANQVSNFALAENAGPNSEVGKTGLSSLKEDLEVESQIKTLIDR